MFTKSFEDYHIQKKPINHSECTYPFNKSLYLTKLATRNNKINSPAQTILRKR